MKKKIALTAVMFVGVIALLSVSGYLGYKSLTAPSSLFELTTGNSADAVISLEQYLAILCFVAAVAILAFIKKFCASRGNEWHG